MQDLSIAFSTCPNDTFMFDAMIHHKIDTEGLNFVYETADIEELNKRAFKKQYDISKVSYFAYLFFCQQYIMLSSGSAIGEHVGPLLISKKDFKPESIPSLSVAVPGKYTTANMLMSFLLPEPKEIHEMLFSDIENAILTDDVDAGVIIHESRFTYERKSLKKMVDLGELWNQSFKLPIPLGGIVTKRSLPDEIKQKVTRIIQNSILYAFQNPESSISFVKSLAKELEDKVIENHIQLYVNEYSLNMGEKGRNAIKKIFELAGQKNIVKNKISGDLVFRY